MKTKTFHAANLGRFAPACSDGNGYITVHDSARYATATDEQLAEWADSRVRAIRNAALVERAERSLGKWQQS